MTSIGRFVAGAGLLSARRLRRLVSSTAVGVTLAVSLVASWAPAGASPTRLSVPTFDPHDYQAKPLRIISIIPGTTADLDDHSSFTSTLYWYGRHMPGSSWLAGVGSKAEYGFDTVQQHAIGRAIVDNGIPTLSGDQADTPWMDYAARVAAAAGLGSASAYRTVYVLYIPCIAGSTFDAQPCGAGAHEPMTSGSTGDVGRHPGLFSDGDTLAFSLISLSGTADKPSCWLFNSSSCLTYEESTISHEVVEGATDTDSTHGYGLYPPDVASPWIPDRSGYDTTSPFVEREEIAAAELEDVALGTVYREHFHRRDATYGNVTYDFVFERVPHRIASAADPWVPAIPGAYYSTTTAKQWYDARVNQGPQNITVSGWATSTAVTPWTARFITEAWDGEADGSVTTSPCAAFSGSPASPHGTLVKNGSTFTMTVALTASTARWCIITIISHRYGDEAPGSSQDTGDTSHPYVVGIILPAAGASG